MKYSNIWVVCAVVILFTACTNKAIEEASTKQEYLDKLDKLSDNARKKQLERDIDYLSDLLSSTQYLKVYNSNVARTKDVRNDSLLQVQTFTLPNVDSVRSEFRSIVHASALQKYGIPSSTFDIRIGDSLRQLSESDFSYQIETIFANNRSFQSDEVGLTKSDSVLVKIDYTFVTSADTLTVSKALPADSIVYKKLVVDILEKEDRLIKIVYPVDLRILDYKAKTADGEIMDYKTFSDFSIFGINSDVQEQIKQLISILKQASAIDSKAQCMQLLESVSDTQFHYYNMLNSFRKIYNIEINKQGDAAKKIDQLPADYIKEYEHILMPVAKELTLTFSKPYVQVMFYVASKQKTFSSQLLAPVEVSPFRRYHVYKDKQSMKYGIVDQKLAITIPAMYDLLKQADDLYYTIPQPENTPDLWFYLDTTQKVLRNLPADISFVKILKPGITVFQNTKGKKGVLSNNKLEIVPYRYDDISLYGNTIIAKGMQGKQSFYELFSVSGKKINLPQIKEIQLVDSTLNLLVRSVDNTFGLISKDGSVAIRPQYYGLKMLNDQLLRFTTDPSYDEYSSNDYLWGIVGVNGKVITKPTYYSVGYFSEGMAPVYIKKGDALRGGYINAEGRVVIEPKYLLVNEFYRGYALVRLLENYCLIDKKGRVTKTFPVGTYVELVDNIDPSKGSFYQSNGKVDYDYQGKIIK